MSLFSNIVTTKENHNTSYTYMKNKNVQLNVHLKNSQFYIFYTRVPFIFRDCDSVAIRKLTARYTL